MTEEFEEEQESLPLVQHLTELRDRLLYALLAVLVVFLSLVYFANDIYAFVSAPLTEVLAEQGSSSLIATDITATFLTPFKLTFFVALFIAMPAVLYQIWAFIAPALYRAERRLALPIFISSVLLFYVGIAFAYFVVFPLVFGFFAMIAPENVAVMPDITQLLSFIIKIFFAFGLAFEIPIATVILIIAGVVSPTSMAAKRPYVIVSCFVIGMFLTPPDILSQAMLAIPMWALFELGIVFGRIAVKPKDTAESSDDDPLSAEDSEPADGSQSADGSELADGSLSADGSEHTEKS